MLALPAWSDQHVLRLLTLFRKHLRHYVYASDTEFVEVVHAELPEKSRAEIQEKVKSLMRQFAVAVDTKNFRGEAIVVDGAEQFVHQHIYESVSQLPENKAGGGMWLPDELSCFFQKAIQQKAMFIKNADKYFERIMIWGKSVADTKHKFYLIREMFMKEKRRPRERAGVDARRYGVLEDLFRGVPPLPRQQKVATPAKGSTLWTSQELKTLVDYTVRITREVQSTGTSDLVNVLLVTLHRTAQSCLSKLNEVKSKYLKKATIVGAASIPEEIYDPTTDANKLFSADWNDPNDPYALGVLAIRSKYLAQRQNRKRKGKAFDLGIRAPRPKRRASITLRERSRMTGNSTSEVEVPTESNDISISTRQPSSRASIKAPAADCYAKFVHDIAQQCRWTLEVAHAVLRCMQQAITLYRDKKLVDFFRKVANSTPAVSFQDVFANTQHILTRFEKDYGTLDGFESVALMVRTTDASAPVSSLEDNEQENDRGVAENTAVTETHSVTTDVLDSSLKEQAPAGDHAANEGQPDKALPPSPPGQNSVEDTADERNSSFDEHHSPGSQNEDAGGEHNLSVPEKQSSPEDTLEDTWVAGEGDPGAEADGEEDNQSVASSDNAWSGSSNASDGHNTHDGPPDSQYSSASVSERSSKRGKDEQYGKSFELAKKRRLKEKPASNADEEDEEEDDDFNDDRSDDDSVAADVDSANSDDEHDEAPHPLQNLLDSLGEHITELEAKRQELIERKEDREWRQRGWNRHRLHQEYTFSGGYTSFD